MAPRRFSQLIVLSALLGCATSNANTDRADGTPGGGIVIRGSEMSGSVLHALRTRIPSVRISTPTGQCPRILFRGDLTANTPVNPSVYVDGTLMGDTCVLNSILAPDVDRVEVYPSGNTPDSTLRRNAAGIIVIYRRRE